MISLLPLALIIRWIAACYAVLVAAGIVLLRLAGPDPDLFGSIKLALGGAFLLQLLILFLVYVGWRWLWRWIPALPRLLFPDLNGRWQMTIHWQRNGNTGQAIAEAIVKQDLLRMSIEVEAPDSDSLTLSVQPKRDPESGRPILHYLYRVTPHSIGPSPPHPYNGAAILYVSDQALRGNYWTSSPSTGHFNLKRAP